MKDGAPGEIRTPDPLVRSQMLYPAELRARAAILPKFACGAADSGFLVAANRTSFDSARNQNWLPGRAIVKRRQATEKPQKAAENLVGLGRLELPTSPLSGVRSSHLSYRPNLLAGNILRDLRRSSNDGATSVSQLPRIIEPAQISKTQTLGRLRFKIRARQDAKIGGIASDTCRAIIRKL
jgi:hypothetical protein